MKNGDFPWLCKCLPEGKPPFSYGFPMVFPWFSYDFTIVLWFSYGFPMVLTVTTRGSIPWTPRVKGGGDARMLAKGM